MTPLILAAAVCSIVTVHDGDTIRCDGEKVRIANIDAPELPGSPRCDPRQLRGGANPSWCDYDLGARSRDTLRAIFTARPIRIERQGIDRFGRTLATVSVNGRDVGEYLVVNGLARPWR